MLAILWRDPACGLYQTMAKKTTRHQVSHHPRRISLKLLGEHLGLSPSTISFVLNDTPGRSIPEATRERVRKAAAEMNYQPSIIARTLRGQRMRTVGILLPELGEGYHTRVISGIGDLLMEQEYFYFTVQHRHNRELIATYPHLLQARGVDGLLAVDTHLEMPLPLPTVLIAGHTELPNITNVVLDHKLGAELAVDHLYALGHREIVYMKGQSFSTDTELRWQATLKAAARRGLKIDPCRTVELTIDSTSPSISYPLIRTLLNQDKQFTAILCFNDISAIGSIRALYDAGLRVPEDVSVVGFDDIQSASFHTPSLTTIRQPLQSMGWAGASALLHLLEGEPQPPILCVEPELIVRESTGPVSAASPKKGSRSGSKKTVRTR
jgi:DNA-binding LacI/PurR family transcriptional regulator